MKATMLLLAARAASLARPARVLGRRGVALRSGDGEAAWPEATLAKIAAGAGTPAALAALKAELAVAGDAPDAAYGACFPFPLDAFQRDALRSLRADRNVIVSAPTGSGKQGRTRVIQRRFNVSVPRARVLGKASTLRDRSER